MKRILASLVLIVAAVGVSALASSRPPVAPRAVAAAPATTPATAPASTAPAADQRNGELPQSFILRTYVVTGVEDGDTITVMSDQGSQSVRLAGYDAPELSYGNQYSQCFALETYTKVKTDLVGRQVYLIADRMQADKDQHGRLVRYVELSDRSDYTESLVRGGYGHEYTYHGKPHERVKRYEQAESEAEAAGRGLWAKDGSGCQGESVKPGIFLQSKIFHAAHPINPAAPITCANFASHLDAQRFYEAHGGPFEDKYGLDPSRNGRACPNLP